MKKTTLRLLAGLATTCALVAPLSGCSSEEATVEWCDEKMASGTYTKEEFDKCNAIYREQEAKAQAEAEEKLQQTNNNLVVKNFKADYERGAYVVTMDIENKNDSDVGDITVTIPYGVRYEDNYGDTQIEDNEFTRNITLIPAKGTHPIKIVLGGDWAKEKMEPIDEKKITAITSGSTVTTDEETQSVSAADFDVKFGSETDSWGYTHFYCTITNNTKKKVESVTLEGYALDKKGNYICDASSYCSRSSVYAQYLKPGQTSEKIGVTSANATDLEVTGIVFANE